MIQLCETLYDAGCEYRLTTGPVLFQVMRMCVCGSELYLCCATTVLLFPTI